MLNKIFILLAIFVISSIVYGSNYDSTAQLEKGRVVVIDFGIGHVDSLSKSSISSAKTLLNNSVKWASQDDSPKILLLVDPDVLSLGERSLDVDFIQQTLSEYSITTLNDTQDGISLSILQGYDLVIWSGESFPLPSPETSTTPRVLLEFFESGNGVILISDDATWDSTDLNPDPRDSSDITKSLTRVTTLSTGTSKDTITSISTPIGDNHPIMKNVLEINIRAEPSPNSGKNYYSNDIDVSIPAVNANVLATTTDGKPTVIVHEYSGERFPINAIDDFFEITEDSKNNEFYVLYNDISKSGRLTIDSFDTTGLVGKVQKQKDFFSFDPKPDFFGKTSFTYVVKDEKGNRDVATAQIFVTPTNDPPIAHDSSFSIFEDNVLKTKLVAKDIDGDKLQYTINQNIDDNSGDLLLESDGRFTYTPPENYVGTTSFSFVASDGKSESLPAKVTIEVVSENDEPIINPMHFSTPEDKILTGMLSAKDPDDDYLTFSLVHDTPASTGQTSVMTHGAFAFIPKKGFFGETHFVFQVDDGENTKQQMVLITVNPKNEPPKAVDKSISLQEDTSTNIILEGVDKHGYQLSYDVTSKPKFGNLTGTGKSLHYVPNENFHGDDEFKFEVNNGRFSDYGTVSIQVTPVNDAPVANDDKATTKENTEVVIPVVFNDEDVDGDDLIVTHVDDPINGKATINLEKAITYKPHPGVVNDLEIFDYTISDAFGKTSKGTIIVEIVNRANTPGKAILNEGSFNSDTVFSLDVDSDGTVFSGTMSYEDSFAAMYVNSENISFFSIDQLENSATFGGTSFDDKFFTIFVDDNGESGRDDVFKIKIRNADGSLVYQKEGTLSAGNAIVTYDFLQVPDWLKNTAKWWGNNQIRDADFIEGIQYMIKNQIIRIPSIPEFDESSDSEIPEWIKQNARWWSEDKISDSEFADGIKFLIVNGVLKL